MHPDVAALVAVQSEDIAIRELEDNLASLLPRIQALAEKRAAAAAELEQARQLLDAEVKRRRDIETRLEQHVVLRDRNEAMLNNITSQREATAATAQLDQAKRMIEEDNRELERYGANIAEMRAEVEQRTETVQRLEREQEEARASVESDKAQLEGELSAARTSRDRKAAAVPRSLLSRYERIRSRKRLRSIFPLRDGSCGHCDTALPIQRRNIMAETGETDICEACGVLLYAE